MFYSKNKGEKLDRDLFRSPTSEYRGTPFWAWNSTLDKEELCRQIEVFKEMGFGGFHMHVRQGLETPYLEKEFMEAVRGCVDKAKSEEMLAWLYDEDRWPSGCAGGIVTKEKKYRVKSLWLTTVKRSEYAESIEEAYNEGKRYLFGAFHVTVDESGFMTEYKRVEDTAEGNGICYFDCVTAEGGEPRYNYQSYSDNLSKECVEKFIEVTHEAYKKEVGEEFGKTVPAIFTDEPQMSRVRRLSCGQRLNGDIGFLPFNFEVPQEFEKEFGYDLLERLPELFFACKSDQSRKTRYDFCRYISEKFNSSYIDTIGTWCGKNNIMLTGHAMGEDSIEESMIQMYEPMRMYKEMQLPGIDVLCDDRCFTTAIQCRSAVRQYGREGMMSELYGVTGWDFDFRGHKFQGDWQACLGVTVRVPHLAWQTMKGEGKRDYPASLSYQSPWYKEYKYIEDHYARINTALTRGKSDAKVAVVHPIESCWLERASDAETKPYCDEIDERFHTLTDWLLNGLVEFDYISQSLLPDLCGEGSAPLKVGKCAYDVIILSDCVTLREHTLNVLEEFKKQGGKIIFTGFLPKFCDGAPSERARALAEGAVNVLFSKHEILKELEEVTEVKISQRGLLPIEGKYMHTVRYDNGRKWLFITCSEKPELKHYTSTDCITVTVKGKYYPTLYDTLTGEIKKVRYEIKNGNTEIYTFSGSYDSLLFALDNEEQAAAEIKPPKVQILKETEAPFVVDYELSEPNVLLLDMAKYSINGGEFEQEEEIMRIDAEVRNRLGIKSRMMKKTVQPYIINDVPEEHTLALEFKVLSEIDVDEALLALENPNKCKIVFNGESISSESVGWYVDKDIRTVKLGTVRKGENILRVTMPFGLRTDLEAMYLLGDFGTKCLGRQAFITERPKKLYFGNIVNQGFSFYGGNITYKTEIDLEKESDIEIIVSYYSGALVKITVDGERTEILAFESSVKFDGLCAGKHTIEYTVYGNRYNTFSALHSLLADKKRIYMGPDFWRSQGPGWAYEYQQRQMGILKTPDIWIF
ncbi:MAG: hypothetical protein E7634_08395 [Ruminococcaceae bacterium]|nr:hypothetical protein [Oscillospiraceae bacterium]